MTRLMPSGIDGATAPDSGSYLEEEGRGAGGRGHVREWRPSVQIPATGQPWILDQAWLQHSAQPKSKQRAGFILGEAAGFEELEGEKGIGELAEVAVVEDELHRDAAGEEREYTPYQVRERS
jgi:hypothetical protein